MGRLFGTDGVRGVANNELTCEMAFNIGRAAAYVLTKETRHKPKILIGKDTRISGDMLEAEIGRSRLMIENSGLNTHLNALSASP